MNAEAGAEPLDLAPSTGDRPAAPATGAKRFDRVRRPWRGLRLRTKAVFGRATTVSVPADHVGLTAPAEFRPAAPAAPVARPQKVKKGWREQRWERRRKRRLFEEVLGWILVPLILISGVWAVKSGLNALGTDVSTLIQGFRTALSAAGRG